MFCVNCGNELPEGVNFCPNCGQKIGVSDKKSLSKPKEGRLSLGAQAFFDQGVEFFNDEEYEKAIKAFNKALKTNPDYYEALKYRVNSYHQLSMYQLMIQDLDVCIQIDPNDAENYYLRGIAYYYCNSEYESEDNDEKSLSIYDYMNNDEDKDEINNIDQAVLDLSTAIKIKEDYIDAYLFRANIYDNEGEIKKALGDLDKLLSIEPNNFEGLKLRGKINVFGTIGEDENEKYVRYEKALLDINKAIEINATDADLFLSRAQINFFKKNHEASLTDLSKALDIDYDKYTLKFRAEEYVILEKYDLAIDDYSALLQDDDGDDDENVELYYKRAMAYIANGDDDNAEKDLDNIISGFEVNGEYIIDNVKLNKYIENEDTAIIKYILHSLLEKSKIQFKREEFFKSVELLIIINSIDSNYLEKLPDSTFPIAVNDKIASIYTKMCEDNGNAMLDFQKRSKLYIVYIRSWDKSKKPGPLCVPGQSGVEWFSIANDPNDSLFFLSLSSAQEYCKFIQSRYEGEIELEIKETKFTPSFWYILQNTGRVFASIRHDGYVNWTDINSAFEFMGTGKKFKNNQEVLETFVKIIQSDYGIHDIFIVGHK